MQKINSCLWFDSQAEDAVKLYASLFKNSHVGKITYYGEAGAKVSGQKKGSIMTIEFELEGQSIIALNGGPEFKFTPALSFFVWCETENEIDALWHGLSKDGIIRMPFDKYHWSKKYGWTADKYGVEWQLMLSDQSKKQKIAPAFMFVDKLFGKGEEAINFYLSLFANSKIGFIARDEANKSILHCVFSLAEQNFLLMEGPGAHDYTFSLAYSLIINCETQAEIDYYWEKLSQGGSIMECGWLTDKYGVSWQVVPTVLRKWMRDPNKTKLENVMQAMLKMKKIDLKVLEEAYANWK